MMFSPASPRTPAPGSPRSRLSAGAKALALVFLLGPHGLLGTLARAAQAGQSAPGAVAPATASHELARAIGERLDRVEEFRFLRAEAARLGVRVWLFGGTAAAYAHYVEWDLRRERGDTRYFPDRFDYDYTNIFRSTQDLDVVVDGSAEKAELLHKELQKQFPHFQGSREAWEVRPLREAIRDKEPILGNRDFLDQHTDSNSTGLVEVSRPPAGEPVVRDARDWESHDPFFLRDVREGRLHYYYSELHEATARAAKGLNPPIFSAIRYLTKAFQYELGMRPEDLARIRQVVQEFDPVRDLKDPYTRTWIEKNAKKLFENAVNLEYAWNTLEKLGLREKLIRIQNNASTEDSLAWWMSREPLRSHRLGELEPGDARHALMPDLRPWKTARELGLDIVSHETRSMLAYESITRSHTGHPNVFISRSGHVREGAAHGNSFYARVGTEGAAGTGLTIRFHLDPDAREGVDFTRAGDYVMVLNRNALKVIPESFSWSALEYLKRLHDGLKIDRRDTGLLEKLRRRATIQARSMSEAELAEVVALVDRVLDESPAHSVFLDETMRMLADRLPLELRARMLPLVDVTEASRELLRDPALARAVTAEELGQLISNYMKSKDPALTNRAFRSVLNEPHWKPEFETLKLFNLFMGCGSGAQNAENIHFGIQSVLSRPGWAKEPEVIEWLEQRLKGTRAGDSRAGMYALPEPVRDALLENPRIRGPFEASLIYDIWGGDTTGGHGPGDAPAEAYSSPRKAYLFMVEKHLDTGSLPRLLAKGIDRDPVLGVSHPEILAAIARGLSGKERDPFDSFSVAPQILGWMGPEDWSSPGLDRRALALGLIKHSSSRELVGTVDAVTSPLVRPPALTREEALAALVDHPGLDKLVVPWAEPPLLVKEVLADPARFEKFLMRPRAQGGAWQGDHDVIGFLLEDLFKRSDEDAIPRIERFLASSGERPISKKLVIRLLKLMSASELKHRPEFSRLVELAFQRSRIYFGQDTQIFDGFDALMRDLEVAERLGLEELHMVEALANATWTGEYRVLQTVSLSPLVNTPEGRAFWVRVLLDSKGRPHRHIGEIVRLVELTQTIPGWQDDPELSGAASRLLRDGVRSWGAKYDRKSLQQLLYKDGPLDDGAWAKAQGGSELVRALIQVDANDHYLIARHVLAHPNWAKHPEGVDLVLELIRHRRSEGDIVHSVLGRKEWRDNPRAHEIVQALHEAGTVEPLLSDLFSRLPPSCAAGFGRLLGTARP